MQRPLAPGVSNVSVLLLATFLGSCGGAGSRGGPPGAGGEGGDDSGGTGGDDSGGSGGTGGQSGGGKGGGGTGGMTGGTGGDGTGGSGGMGGTGGGDQPDAGPPASPDGGGAGSGGTGGSDVPPAATAQGPVAAGKIAFSQDFEQNMDGMERSPGGLPVDRIQIVDDPIHQRGKVVRIHYEAGDNFRTSGGTEPRSWFSSAKGYTAKAGTVVSVAWGFMWENVSMGAHFAQIIRDGGPLWMFDVDTGGTVRADVHRGSGSTGAIMKLEPMKWYDFRVDTDYRAGGAIKFFVNDKMVGQGKGDGGGNGRFDCGIYWEHGAKPTRTVYVSNVSIGEL